MGDLDDFKSRYLNRLDKELGVDSHNNPISTHAYLEFKQEYLPKHLSWYEKACKFAGKILTVKPSKKNYPKLEKSIQVSHLEISPTDSMSFALLGPMLFIVVASFLGYFLSTIISPLGTGSVFMIFFCAITGLIMIYPLQRMPFYLANSWRMKASNQMVLCVFYIVTYMRHTSNYELAVDFAAEHLSPPLSLDMKKVIWDIETGKYDTLKEAMDNYLRTWEDYNKEFIESMHLIESSLYENSETRRLDALDKALSVMLSETYEKMLHFAHNLKSPLQALHMLGIVLPILGLVILPLMVSFMSEVEWYHVMVIYNIALPIGVYYMGKNIMSTRPTGYGETKVDDETGFEKFKNVILKFGKMEVKVNPIWFAFSVFGILLFIGLLPLLIHAANPEYDWILTDRSQIEAIPGYQSENAIFYFLGYRPVIKDGEVIEGAFIGPFGIGATLLSLFIPLSIGLGLGLFYRLRSKNLIKIRKKSKELEEEFAASLFQLGNRLGDGVPVEIAFERVSQVMGDSSISGKFFMLVSVNIRKLGMGLEQAIFDPHKGALAYYPSNLIESSMKVLVQASRKGPLVASQALINVSEYIKQMHRVDERLKDLMADIVSDMRSQISFLTPAIAGIVVGITSMITKILGSLGENVSSIAGDAGTGSALSSGALGFFGSGMPTYWFQAIVGVYVVQVVFILTTLVNGIQNGSDKLMEQDALGKYMIRTTVTYCIIAFIIMLLFNMIAGPIIQPFTS